MGRCRKYAGIVGPLVSTGAAFLATEDTGPSSRNKVSAAIRGYKEIGLFRFSVSPVDGGLLITKTGLFQPPLIGSNLARSVGVSDSFDIKLAELEDELRSDLEAVVTVRRLIAESKGIQHENK